MRWSCALQTRIVHLATPDWKMDRQTLVPLSIHRRGLRTLLGLRTSVSSDTNVQRLRCTLRSALSNRWKWISVVQLLHTAGSGAAVGEKTEETKLEVMPISRGHGPDHAQRDVCSSLTLLPSWGGSPGVHFPHTALGTTPTWGHLKALPPAMHACMHAGPMTSWYQNAWQDAVHILPLPSPATVAPPGRTNGNQCDTKLV